MHSTETKNEKLEKNKLLSPEQKLKEKISDMPESVNKISEEWIYNNV